jgi:hypothetical protein
MRETSPSAVPQRWVKSIQIIKRSLSGSSNRLRTTSATPTPYGHICLVRRHLFLVSQRVWAFALERPGEELVGVVRLVLLVEHPETFTISGDLVLFPVSTRKVWGEGKPHPVTADVLQVLGEVGERALKDLVVHCRSHGRLHVYILGVCLLGRGEDVVDSLLDGSHKLLDLFRVVADELVVGCSTIDQP